MADEANGVLDLGFSYVDPGSKYSQVTPLLVENKSDQDVFITCQSNLSHQVLIFMDEAGERGLVEMMPLKCGSMTTVWVAVQPNLLTGYLGNSADECRELVGGIKFSVYEKDDSGYQQQDQEQDMLLMLTQTVKFISIIGQSHLEVSDKVINLGYTDLLQSRVSSLWTMRWNAPVAILSWIVVVVPCMAGVALKSVEIQTWAIWTAMIKRGAREVWPAFMPMTVQAV